MNSNFVVQINKTRTQRAQRNIFSSIVGQLVILICGIIVPQLFIKTYGSEAYGATASITQFLSYIVLLEGGIGGVARAALYKPLAEGKFVDVTKILNEIKFLFKMIGYVFAVYVLVIAFSFKSISHIQYYDWVSTALLVLVISLSTFAQYFIGISNMVLLQADQKTYITNTVNMVALILNTLLIIVLVHLHFGLIFVKFISAFVFVLRPCVLWWYVHTHYPLAKTLQRDKIALQQKWSGLGQHLAFFLHSNTDIVILTLFTNLKIVAVYSVYNMIASQIQGLITSFTTGMEALFGDMLARQEMKMLNRTFTYYETLISLLAVPICVVTLVLISSFVKLYTQSVTDVNYIYPTFSALLVLSVLIYCLRTPYHSLTIAAGHFRPTQWAAYGEAIINVSLSVALVCYFGLIGVAIGTLTATIFRFVYYVWYLSGHISQLKKRIFVKRMGVNIINFLLILLPCYMLLKQLTVSNYFQWILLGSVISIFATCVSIVVNYLFYSSYIKSMSKQLKTLLKGALC